MTSTAAETSNGRLAPEFLITLVILVSYVIWTLWIPAWPSQDGPVHLYYAEIFGKLLRHSDPTLQQYFQIKHLLPPYALYYYALVALSGFASPFLADRLIICCYLVSCVFGFRFVAKRLGASGETATLLATVLLFNWPLGMGFVNYCLAISFALWGLGLWLRFGQRNDLGMRVIFVALAFVIMLTHPVPLMLMLGLCAVLLGVDVVIARWAEPVQGGTRLWMRDIITLLVSGLTFIYIKIFTTTHPFQAVLPESGSLVVRVIRRAMRLAKEDGMAVLFGPFPPTRIYRFSLIILLIVCIAVGLQHTVRCVRQRSWTPSNSIFVLGLLLLVGLPFIPLDLNGLFYFADRLPLLVWLTLLLGAASWSMPSRSGETGRGKKRWVADAVIVFAIVANGALLIAMTRVIWPISRAMVAVDAAPRSVAQQVGFIIEDVRQPVGGSNAPSWNPYYWSAIDVVRHNDAILANAPWMDETILPVGPGPALPEERIPVLQTPMPTHLYGELMDHPEQRLRAMDALSFVVVQQHGRPPLIASDDLMTKLADGAQGSWKCQTGAAEWYRLCRHQ